MSIEGTNDHGSMYGVVDSLRSMTDAMEQLLQYLPEDFVWPQLVSVSPYSVNFDWGHRDSFEEPLGKPAVWIIAAPEGVVMNANFRPGWPECGASAFDAEIAAGWLLELTKGWEWGASREGGHTSSSLRRS